MSGLKKCCRYCSYFSKDRCTHEAFVECVSVETVIDEMEWCADVRKVLAKGKFDTFFKDKSPTLKQILIDEIVDELSLDVERICDSNEDMLVCDPDNFYCAYYK